MVYFPWFIVESANIRHWHKVSRYAQDIFYRVFTNVLSCFHYRTIAFSLSCTALALTGHRRNYIVRCYYCFQLKCAQKWQCEFEIHCCIICNKIFSSLVYSGMQAACVWYSIFSFCPVMTVAVLNLSRARIYEAPKEKIFLIFGLFLIS